VKIEKVAVIGMGAMGSQIGIVCARAGFSASMVDLSQDAVQRGLASIDTFLKQQEKKGKIQPGEKDKIFSRISAGGNLEEVVSDADLVIEAVFEDIQVKKRVFERLDKASPGRTILATNTSTLWVTEIAAATNRPSKCSTSTTFVQ